MANGSKQSPELEIPIYIWQPPPFDAAAQTSLPEFKAADIKPPIGEMQDDFCLNDLISSADSPPRARKWEPKKKVDRPKTRYEHHDENGHDDGRKVAELFRFIVAKFAVFSLHFNEAYKLWNADRRDEAAALYNATRLEYLQFVNELDTRHSHDDDNEPGYGRPIKWVDVLPDLRTDSGERAAKGPIKGLRVVVKWNPCSSTHRGFFKP